MYVSVPVKAALFNNLKTIRTILFDPRIYLIIKLLIACSQLNVVLYKKIQE